MSLRDYDDVIFGTLVLSTFIVPTTTVNVALKESVGTGFGNTSSEAGSLSTQDPVTTSLFSTVGGSLSSSAIDKTDDFVHVIFRRDNVAYDNIDRRADNIYNILCSKKKKAMFRPSIIMKNKGLYHRFLNEFLTNKGSVNLEKLYALRQVLEKING